MDCGTFREGLTTIAEGGSNPEAARHVEGCAACAERLTIERRIVQAARLAQREPPADLLARAYAFMPPRPRFVARLVGSGLAASGMRRSGSERFSLHLQAEGQDLHLQYAPLGKGWQVLGRAPSPDWSVERAGESTPTDAAGRFRMEVPSLDDSAFVLRTEGIAIDVPSVTEILQRDA